MNFKRLTATLLAATLVFGSTLTVLADDPSATGKGTFEGIEPEYPDVVIDLPTAASAATYFNYTADPNGLMGKYGDATLKAKLPTSGDTKVYFEDADGNYQNKSRPVEVQSENARDLDVKVKVELDGEYTGNIAFATSGTWTSDQKDKEIYLAVAETGNDTGATANVVSVDTTSKTFSMTITGVPSNFEVVRTPATGTEPTKYEYKQKDTLAAAWNKKSFYVAGAINTNASWKDATEATPSIKLTWSAKEHKTLYVDKDTISATNNTLTLTLPTGVSISKVTCQQNGGTAAELPAARYTVSGTTLTFTSATVGAFAGGKFVIYYSDDHTDELTIE